MLARLVRTYWLIALLAAAPGAQALTPEAPPQSSLCSTLDPLSVRPIEQCMNEMPGEVLAGEPDEALLQRLLKLQFGGKAADALRQIDDEIARRPLSPALYFIRGMLLQADDKQFDAIVEYNRALSLEPRMLPALVQRGWARARMNDLQGALADTDQVLAIAPGHPSALLNKAMLLVGTGQRDEGMAMLGDLIRASAEPGELLLIRAQLRIGQGHAEEALADLARASELLPQNPQIFVLRANILIQKQEFRNALADLDRAIALGSPVPDLLLWRANLKQRLDDKAGAEADFSAYAAKDPLRAADVLRQARINLKPDTERLTVLTIELQENMLRQDIAGVEKAVDELLKLTPGDQRLYSIKAMAAFMRLDCDGAMAFVEKLPAPMREQVAVLGPHSACLVKQGRGDEAVPISTRLVALAPGHTEALRTHAAALMVTGRFDESAATIKSLLALGAGSEHDEASQILALNYARKREEAGRLAVDFIRRHGSDNLQIGHVFTELVFSLERDPTWPLAIELLGVYTPPPERRDAYEYLKARGLIHQGRPDEALAALARIRKTDSSPAMFDAQFEPLWETPEFIAAFDPATAQRRSFERLYAAHVAAPEALNETLDLIDGLGALGCAPQALDHARRVLKSAALYPKADQFSVNAYGLAAGLEIDRGNMDAAAKTFDAGLEAVEPLVSAGLLLQYAQLMVVRGQHARALILADLALKRGITPFGRVVAHNVRAFAFDGLGDAKGRDEALDYVEAHWRDNAGATLDGLGMLRSYDRAVAIIGEAAQDPERGRSVLARLNLPVGGPTIADLDKRVAAFVQRLRSDPKVIETLAPVGRIRPPAYQSTCPLTEQELTARPISYPFEKAAASEQPKR